MDDHIEAYPLRWPVGRPRASCKKHARFGVSLARGRDHLMGEIRLLGGKQAILSSDMELRLDGLPYANQRQPDDLGVAVYFTYKGTQHCFACDEWDRVKDNVRAIGKTIEALRGISRWGTGDMMERAFQGFKALPSPTQWWHVLGFDTAHGLSRQEVDWRYKKLAMQRHPDRGGSGDMMAELTWARDQAREQLATPIDNGV